MKTFVAVLTAGAIIAGGSLAAYAAPSVLSNKKPAEEAQVVASRATVNDVPQVTQQQIDALMNHPVNTVKPFEGMDSPNKSLLARDDRTWAQMIKELNATGEYMNETAIIGFMRGMANSKIKTPDDSSQSRSRKSSSAS